MLSEVISRAINNRTIILLRSVTGLFLISPFAFAQTCGTTDNCNISVDFQGVYTESTCELSINNGSASETVSLPVISVDRLNSDGSEAGSQSFDIELKNCPTNKPVTLRFASSAAGVDTQTGNLLNTMGNSYSKNVELRLRKSDQQKMVVDDINSVQEYDLSTATNVKHSFIASYYAAGSSPVTAGILNTSAAIVINYK